MFKFIWFLVSSFLSVFLARSLEGAVAKTQAVAFTTIDSVTRRLLRKFAWTLIGIVLFTTGLVLSIIDVSEMWQGEMTLSLAMKLTLTLIGIGFLYAGLAVPKAFVLQPVATRAGYVDAAGRPASIRG